MPVRFEVSVWKKDPKGWHYQSYWVGRSRIKAIRQLRKAKKQYPNCVKLEWR